MQIEALTKRLRQFAEDRDWDQFHAPKNLSMALMVEAAELAEHFQWLSEQQSMELSSEKLKEVSYEVADVFIYCLRLADNLGVDLANIVDEKIAINEKKYPANKVRGSSKKYTEYE